MRYQTNNIRPWKIIISALLHTVVARVLMDSKHHISKLKLPKIGTVRANLLDKFQKGDIIFSMYLLCQRSWTWQIAFTRHSRWTNFSEPWQEESLYLFIHLRFEMRHAVRWVSILFLLGIKEGVCLFREENKVHNGVETSFGKLRWVRWVWVFLMRAQRGQEKHETRRQLFH